MMVSRNHLHCRRQGPQEGGSAGWVHTQILSLYPHPALAPSGIAPYIGENQEFSKCLPKTFVIMPVDA
jgi:hypothetical protein